MSPTWTNWGGTVSAVPERVLTPGSVDELAHAVARSAGEGRRLKVVGAGHSFTAVAAPSQDQVRLDRLSGIVAAQPDQGRVTVWAGTPLHVLNPALEALGLAMPNLGDIDRQTISGAIATGTHGTGALLPGLAAAVRGLTLVTGDGTVVHVDEQSDPDVFAAARVGLGAVGIIASVDLQLVPAFALHAVERPGHLDEVLEQVHETAAVNRHFELYWFPHTDRVLTKRNNIADPDHPGHPLPRWRERLDDHLLANVLFERVNRLVARRPSLAPRVAQLSARALSAREFTDTSYRVFCTPREVRFTESEYAVPVAALVPVLTELRAWVDGHDENLPFPVEVRFAAADDIWLSTAYERDNAYIAVHQYHRMDNRRYFRAFEAIARAHGGRPHWGKVHGLTADDLRALYPRFADFVAVRERVDPARVFTNPYLDRVLGA